MRWENKRISEAQVWKPNIPPSPQTFSDHSFLSVFPATEVSFLAKEINPFVRIFFMNG